MANEPTVSVSLRDVDEVVQEIQALQSERDELGAEVKRLHDALAASAAAETDAVKARQECEAELREARAEVKRLELLVDLATMR